MHDIVDTDIVVVLRHGQVVEGSDEMRLMYHATLLSAANELTELRATLDKLPKDSEGKSVVFRQVVWVVCDGSHWWLEADMWTTAGLYQAAVVSNDGDGNWLLELLGWQHEPEWWDGPVHGTKEAAVAAKEK